MDAEDRLLWMMTGTGNCCGWRSGAPSLLGLDGGAFNDAVTSSLEDRGGFEGGGDATTLCLGFLAGDAESPPSFLNFWLDFLGGGLGVGLIRFFLGHVFAFLSMSRTVEFDEEELTDSLTAARPWPSAAKESIFLVTLPVLLLVTSGRVWAGLMLPCLALGGGIRIALLTPGD